MAVHTRDDHHRGVFTVCGSLGEISANRAALHVVHRTLAESAVPVVDDATLGVIPPLQPDLVDTPGDAVATFRRHIADASAVIIAAPEYAGSLAGSVKNALDWVVGSGELYEKPVGILSAGTSGGPFASGPGADVAVAGRARGRSVGHSSTENEVRRAGRHHRRGDHRGDQGVRGSGPGRDEVGAVSTHLVEHTGGGNGWRATQPHRPLPHRGVIRDLGLHVGRCYRRFRLQLVGGRPGNRCRRPTGWCAGFELDHERLGHLPCGVGIGATLARLLRSAHPQHGSLQLAARCAEGDFVRGSFVGRQRGLRSRLLGEVGLLAIGARRVLQRGGEALDVGGPGGGGEAARTG